jgi:hypothetical protein
LAAKVPAWAALQLLSLCWNLLLPVLLLLLLLLQTGMAAVWLGCRCWQQQLL